MYRDLGDEPVTMRTKRLVTFVEATLAGIAGATIGFVVGLLAFGIFAIPAAIVAGLNGLVSGVRGIYDWRSAKGWIAFLADSTWALLGTTMSLVVHGINALKGDSRYQVRLSRRRNRHVYDSGFALKPNLALTQGNVISNAGQGRHELIETFLDNHEGLHIWQGRLLGPLFQFVYVLWFPLGVVVGFAVWLRNRKESLPALVETASYYNNPLEYWAYRNDKCWPPRRAHPKLHWGRACDDKSPPD
jgi:hypothetical protein